MKQNRGIFLMRGMEAYFMKMGITDAQLERMHEYCKEMLKITEATVKERRKIIDNTETEEDWKMNQEFEPEIYYHLRVFEKEIAITKTNRVYDPKFKQYVRTNKPKYTIMTKKYIPRKLGITSGAVEQKYENHFGEFETLEHAKIWYMKVLRMFVEELCEPIQSELNIIELSNENTIQKNRN